MRELRLALATLILAVAALLPADAAMAKPAFTPAERAAAIVGPAVVYLEIQWEGWVRHKVTGALLDDRSVSLSTRCSGFAVSNDGYVVTAGHCVDPGLEGVAPSFFAEIAARTIARGLALQSHAPQLVEDMRINASVVGQPVGEPPNRKVYVQRGVAKSGLTSGEAIPARVVSIQPVSGGDVALIKVEKSNLPMVALANSTDLKVGAEVLAAGYPAADISDETIPAFVSSGKIGKTNLKAVPPTFEASAPTTPAMSGGPIANLDGEIVGLVSHGPTAANVAIASSLVAEELNRNKVENHLGKIDDDYRSGLDAYYDGRYTDSIEKFDAVLATLPSHAQAVEFRRKAQDLRQAEGGGHSSVSGNRINLGVVVAVVGALVLLAMVTRGRVRLPWSRPPGGLAGRSRGRAGQGDALRYCTNCSTALPAGTGLCATCGQRFP